MRVYTFEEIDALYPVEAILAQMGLQNVQDKGRYFIFSSPYREDKNPSMVLYKNNLMCVDFGTNFKRHFFSFFREVYGQQLLDFLNVPKAERGDFPLFQKPLIREKKEQSEPQKELYIEGTISPNFGSNPQAKRYLEERQVSPEFIEYFMVSHTHRAFIQMKAINVPAETQGTPFYNRICVPIYAGGKLISIEGRDYTRRQRAKVVYPRGSSPSHILFNLDNLDRKKPLVIVEGIMDMTRIWDYITKNVTTIFGANISESQKRLIREFDHVIVFPDVDHAGESMVREFFKFYDRDFYIAQLPYSDPGDVENISLNMLQKAIDSPKPSAKYYVDQQHKFSNVQKQVEKQFWSK